MDRKISSLLLIAFFIVLSVGTRCASGAANHHGENLRGVANNRAMSTAAVDNSDPREAKTQTVKDTSTPHALGDERYDEVSKFHVKNKVLVDPEAVKAGKTRSSDTRIHQPVQIGRLDTKRFMTKKDALKEKIKQLSSEERAFL